MIQKTLIGILTFTAILLVLGTVAASDKPIDDWETIVLPLPISRAEPNHHGWRSSEESVEEIAQPYLKKLDRLHEEGIVVDYELLVKENAIRVTVNDTGSLRVIDELQLDVEITPIQTSISTCGENRLGSLYDDKAEWIDSDKTTKEGNTTDPSISVLLKSDYAILRGHTSPNVEVTMVVKDSFDLIRTQGSKTSNADGTFYFGSDYFGCKEYGWLLGAGDVVEVSASGNTVSMVVVPISAYPDPVTKELTGNTAPDREIDLYIKPSLFPCNTEYITTTVTSDDIGFFSTDLIEGFDRSGSAYVIVYDENGNDISADFSSPHIRIDYDGEFNGSLEPRGSFSVSLNRGDKIIESIGGLTDRLGMYEGTFVEPLQAGDVIEARSSGEIVSTIYAEVNNLFVDLDAQTISGNVSSEGEGRRVLITPCRADEVECERPCGCSAGAVDVSGEFSLDFNTNEFDLQRGDSDGTPILFDDQGNTQLMQGILYVPFIEVEPYDNSLNGHWIEPGILVTATLRDSIGVLKEIDTDITSDYSTYFSAYFNTETIEAGDRIDVTDGTFTMTVSSVPTLTAYLDAELDTVSGKAPGTGSLVVDIWKNQYLSDHFNSGIHYCYPRTNSEANYSIDFSSTIDSTAQDKAYVYFQEQDGHLIESYSHAFSLNVMKGGNRIKGYTPLPEKEVVVELWRGGSLLSTDTTTSYDDGRYYAYLPLAEQILITQGDTIKVIPEDMVAYDLLIPELTLNEDQENNIIFGKAPANSKLHVYLERLADWKIWWSELQADNDGNYIADFTGNYKNCLEAQVGDCNHSQTFYFNDAGHTVFMLGPSPKSVSADTYESDDNFSMASTYDGIQAHTFHVSYDDDWIKFTVSDDDVGKTYILATKNLGINANTNMVLYDTDGITEISSDITFSPASSLIIWEASTPGTYYIEIVANSVSDTQDCGSTYDFEISHGLAYLPLLTR